ncbi:MAG TPA: hypothetical protein VF252_13540 [Gemmatimonadales bacterium]
MLTAALAALVLAAAVAGILFVTRRGRRPGIRPASELQREYRLYAQNRPVVRLDPSQVPPNLRHLVPLAEKWGIGDDIMRGDYINRVNDAAKRELHDSFYGPYEEITAWLSSFGDRPMSDEAAAFMYALGALDEMGYFILEEKAKGGRPPSTALFHLLQPEVAGGWGPHTEAQRHTHPPTVTHLHYEFEGWSGDDLLTTFPEFIVTENLARALEQSGLTGFRLTSVETSAGGMWMQMHERRPLPSCRWLKITAPAGGADFGRTNLADLVVSQSALDFLKGFTLTNCLITPWKG